MSSPSKGCQDKVGRLGRYLVTQPRAAIEFAWQDAQHKLLVFTGAGWAGCRTTRKLTSGGAMMLGQHAVKTWSKTQSLLALSPGEGEIHAALRASAGGLGLMSLLRDFGYEVKGGGPGIASAALGIINRRGLGRARHIDTGLLSVQQAAAEKRLRYSKVLGTINPADLVTQYLTADANEGHCPRPSVHFALGRASSAPTLSSIL